MARLRKPELLNLFAQAVNSAGWNVLYLSEQHPFLLRLYRDEEARTVRLYIWNLTHGGGEARPADEYRIQVTGIDNTVGFVGDGADRILILGWWPEAEVFAGFDVRHHSGSLGASPSMQVREDTLRHAVINKVGTQNKGNGEIVVAFQPSFIMEYIQDLESLHSFGESTADLQVLDNVINAPYQVNAQTLLPVTAERKQVVATVARKLRDAGFKDRVLTAYSQRCTFCGLQLRLVEAAHIVPVTHLNDDSTHNGLALCVLHHRAFDRALVTLNPEYQIIVSETKCEDLTESHLDGGLKEFRKNLRAVIQVPPAVSDRPNIALIKQANELRGWET